MIRVQFAPRLSRPAMAALMATVAGAAGAQAPSAAPRPANPPMAQPAAQPVFPIRGFRVEGDNPIGDAEAQRILAPYVRNDATLETLQQATAALEKELRDRGYGLHRVALVPQEVGSTVRLNVVKFTIGKVDIQGNRIYGPNNIRRTVPELKEGEAPNFRRLAIQTAIANENPNKQVQVGLRESEQPDRIDATIHVKEQEPWAFGANWSNAGSDATGEDRFTVTVGHTNLFNLDHQFAAAYTTSFDRLDDVRQVGLQYKVPLYELGGVLGVVYTRSDVVGNFGTFTSTGAGHTFGVAYTWYLAPQGGRRSYVTFALDDKLFEQTEVGSFIANQDRRSRPISVTYSARVESDRAVYGYDLGFAVNTGWGRANDLAAYRSEFPGIDRNGWKAIRGGGSYSAQFAGNWLVTGRTAFQYSPDSLIAGEQFGLGGVTTVRGTDIERPIAGDKGLAATLEVSTPELLQGLRAHAFVDAGWIGNNVVSPQRPRSDSLASVGLGLRWFRGPWNASAEYGRIVDGSRIARTDLTSAPKRGDDRVYVSVGVRF